MLMTIYRHFYWNNGDENDNARPADANDDDDDSEGDDVDDNDVDDAENDVWKEWKFKNLFSGAFRIFFLKKVFVLFLLNLSPIETCGFDDGDEGGERKVFLTPST